MRTRALLCALFGALMLAAPASAATVTMTSRTETAPKGPDYTVTTVRVEAAAGEANTITTSVAGAQLVLSDPAAPLTATGGCTQKAERSVECPVPMEIRVLLGDGNDAFTLDPAATASARLDGGTGDDVLSGGAGSDALLGGGGRDVLRAGAGDDQLSDDDAAAPDADVLDAGPGNDAIGLEDHVAGMTVDLSAGTTSEGDTLTGAESIRLGPGADIVTGTAARDFIYAGTGANSVDGAAGDDNLVGDGDLRGSDGNDAMSCGGPAGCRMSGGAGADNLQSGDGDDTLDGGDGNDELMGLRGDDLIDGGAGNDILRGDLAEGVPGAGDDTLRGGPGDDRVFGGPGADELDGGAGNDAVLALDRERDAIDCGTGRDKLLRDSHDPGRPSSCERVQLGAMLALLEEVEYFRDGRLRGVSVDTLCPQYAIGACRGVAELRDVAGRLLGRRTYRAGAGSDSIEIALNAAGRRAFTKGRHTVVMRVRGGDGTGGSSVVSRTYRIRV